MAGLEDYVRERKLVKMPFIRRYSRGYMRRARTNLATMSLLHDLMYNTKAKEILKVPDNYTSIEWVIVSGYYAMYMAACAALAKIGYRSYDHGATICALEEFFVKKEMLEPEYLKMLKGAQLEGKYVDDLRIAKESRQIAQYDVTKETTEDIAEGIREDAPKFVNRMDLLLKEIV